MSQRKRRSKLGGASTTARGYGSAHQKLRKRVEGQVANGVLCARCGKPIYPGEPWDLAHSDENRSVYTGAEHRGCNRGAPSRRKGRTGYQRPELPPIERHSREW